MAVKMHHAGEANMLLSLVVLTGLTGSNVNPFYWEGRLAAGQAIEIWNTYGSIRAEPATGSRAEVVAQHPDLQIEVTEGAHGISIRAVHADDPERAVPVDFTVRVPKGVRFVGRTVNGNVEARSLEGDAAGYTVNGDVQISATGESEAETVNGSIVASMGSANMGHDLRFASVNGGITLHLPHRLNANVNASTSNGGIRSDFPLAVQVQASGHSASGIVGRGGRELKLATVNGSIRLRRAPGA